MPDRAAGEIADTTRAASTEQWKGRAAPIKELEARELAIERSDPERPPFRLRGLNFSVRGGELVLLRGPSGCGKSSLLLALARLLPLGGGGGGRLLLNGLPASAYPPSQWRTRVAVVPAEPVMLAGTIEENLRLPWRFRASQGKAPPSVAELHDGLKALGLGDLGLGAAARGLSSGQSQRVALLRTMLPRPDFLLLDEPTANLDRESARAVWAAIGRLRKETGCGVLCATHLGGAPSATRTIAIRDGTLHVSGKPGRASVGHGGAGKKRPPAPEPPTGNAGGGGEAGR